MQSKKSHDKIIKLKREMERRFYPCPDIRNGVPLNEKKKKQTVSVLKFLLKYAEIIKYSNEMNYTYYRSNFIPDNILLSNSGLDDIFEILKNKNVAFQINAVEKNIFFADEEPEIFFNITEVEGNKFKLKWNIDVFSYDILQGRKYIYLLLL